MPEIQPIRSCNRHKRRAKCLTDRKNLRISSAKFVPRSERWGREGIRTAPSGEDQGEETARSSALLRLGRVEMNNLSQREPDKGLAIPHHLNRGSTEICMRFLTPA